MLYCCTIYNTTLFLISSKKLMENTHGHVNGEVINVQRTHAHFFSFILIRDAIWSLSWEQPGWDASPSSGTMHTHIHTISTPSSMLLGGGKKPENQEETYTDMERTCMGTPHRQYPKLRIKPGILELWAQSNTALCTTPPLIQRTNDKNNTLMASLNHNSFCRIFTMNKNDIMGVRQKHRASWSS